MSLYKQLNETVRNSGFLNHVPNGVGASSTVVEKMAVLPQNGKMAELRRVFDENHIKYNQERKMFNKEYYDCLTFVLKDYPDFASAIRSVGKLRGIKNRASERFDMRVENLLTKGESVGWQTYRVTKEEWQEIIKLLKPFGITLSESDGYMWLKKIPNAKVYQRATQTLEERFFNILKSRYPNIPDENLKMIAGMDDAQEIYYYLRHVAPGNEYLHPIAEEYASAKMWHNGRGIAGGVEEIVFPDYNWYCRGYVGPDREKSPKKEGYGFHMSLNVNLTDGTLRELDKVLAMDKGRSIWYYKFPMSLGSCHRRYDTITIYLYNRNPEIEAAVARAVAPYVRNNYGLIGEMVGPGCAIAEETGKKYKRSVGEHEADIILANLHRMRGENR